MKADRRSTRLLPFLLCISIGLAGCVGGGTPGEDPTLMRWGGDLIGGGSAVTVADSVPGDVIVGGEEIEVSGTIGGDLLGGGNTLAIGGRILGDVRAAGGEVRLSGQVARNVTAAGREVQVQEGATIERNAYFAGQLILVDGTISGSLRAAGQAIEIDGTVEGDVEVRGGALRVGPAARITGDLTYRVPGESAVVDPAAQIGGTVTAHPASRPDPPIGLFRVLLMIGFLAAGAAVVALFSGALTAAEAGVRRSPGAALGYGLLWLILVPLCIAAIGLTIVGIPLALILFALYLISVYLGRVVIALWLGRMILRDRQRPARGRLVAAFLIGGLVLLLVGLIPYVGALLALAATVLGLGSLVVAYRGRDESDEQLALSPSATE